MKKILSILLLAVLSIVNGQNECYHTVISGDNLYRIGIEYGTNELGVKKLNPGITSALSLGQKVKVPCNNGGAKTITKPLKNVSINNTDEFKGNYLFHTVVKGETIYSLTKNYNISQKRFKTDNEEVLKEGLKLGSVVKIYQRDRTSEDEVAIDGYFLSGKQDGNINVIRGDSLKLYDSSFVNIAVILPFHFEKNVEFLKKFKDEQEPQIYKRTRTFLELYQGIKMAVDSIVEQGLNAQLYVYDSKEDTNVIKTIITQPSFRNMDLVIGPGLTRTFVFAAKLLQRDSIHIPMVSPFSKKDAVINGFPNAIRIIPSDKSRYKAIGAYVGENYLKENIIIAMQDKNDEKHAKVVQREIIAKSLLVDSGQTIIPMITEGVSQPIERIQEGKRNIIILANKKEAFSSKLSAKLIPSSSKADLLLFGLDDLKKYKNIEVDYWDSLNIHIVSASDVKFGYPLTDNFMKNYFKKYYAEPSSYAFTGFDFTFILLKQMLQNRSSYSHEKLVDQYFVGGMRDYQFTFNGEQNGISNKSVNVYKYSNYKFLKLNE